MEGNLRYRPFSEDGFIDDLRTARGVIASGGFTLMGEAVYLRRPMLAVPVGGQFEQVLNARYLEAEGYGLGADELTPERLSEFLERLPDFERRLAGYNQQRQRRAAREARRICCSRRARAGRRARPLRIGSRRARRSLRQRGVVRAFGAERPEALPTVGPLSACRRSSHQR